MAARRYVQQKRAENRDDTRLRIVEAAIALHETLGPARTPISAIADRAGVQRLTVYRHFADEDALLAACMDHWRTRHPLPDPRRWAGIADRDERLLTAMTALYSHYRGTHRLWHMAWRDGPSAPGLRRPLEQVRVTLADYAARLADGPDAGAASRATLLHAVQFATWESLDAQGLDDGEMADLVLGWVAGLRPAPKT